jgi:hypothetical protein
MIIFGWRAITRNGEKGKFNCPQCKSQRDYQRKKIQRFFTLFFVPLIPLQVLQESIQCQLCKKQFVPDILKYDPKAEAEAKQRLVTASFRTVLAHFGSLSDKKDAELFDLIPRLMSGLGCEVMSAEEAKTDIANSAGDFAGAAEKIRPYLTDQGRELLVKGALLAATTDGALTPTKQDALTALAKSLTMTDAHFKGVVASWFPAVAVPASG